eukprot:GDKJ01020231.1.p2 GENE.GDKJ01020231.1~~GDKJ01020231.1.p2  ORF type:complete len:191 (+),score=0.40 GDKJ01020231.1:380-952(+)
MASGHLGSKDSSTLLTSPTSMTRASSGPFSAIGEATGGVGLRGVSSPNSSLLEVSGCCCWALTTTDRCGTEAAVSPSTTATYSFIPALQSCIMRVAEKGWARLTIWVTSMLDSSPRDNLISSSSSIDFVINTDPKDSIKGPRLMLERPCSSANATTSSRAALNTSMAAYINAGGIDPSRQRTNHKHSGHL